MKYGGYAMKKGIYVLCLVLIIILLLGTLKALDKNNSLLHQGRASDIRPVPGDEYYAEVRLAMREMEGLGEAVDEYKGKYYALPESLDALVPEFLEYIPGSPWNSNYAYEKVSNDCYKVSIILPYAVCMSINSLIYSEDGWEKYADCLLTDEEKHWLSYDQLSRIRAGLGIYLVDYNFYPETLQALIDGGYIHYAPSDDPYRHSYYYEISKEGYRLTSYGKDGIKGGQKFNMDTVFQNKKPWKQGLYLYRTIFEYILDSPSRIGAIMSGLGTYMVDYNYYPGNLASLIDGKYIEDEDVLYDIYNHPIFYNRLDLAHYILIATGKDGIPNTDYYETKANTGVFTYIPSAGSSYLQYHKKGIFEGGVLPSSP